MNAMDNVKYFDHNQNGCDYIVGDLHGCFNDFREMLKRIGFDKTRDRMFSVGDLCDRGPDSVGCLSLMYEPWFHAVRGNHEQMMIDSVINNNNNVWENWIYNGGNWYNRIDIDLLKQLAEKANELPYIIVIGKESEQRFNIVHAELFKAADEALVADEDIDEWFFQLGQEDNMIWGRTIASNKSLYRQKRIDNPGLSTTFVGHTPVGVPFKCLNHVFIDTGAVYTHFSNNDTMLTMVRLDEPNKMIQYNIKTKEITDFFIED